MPRRSAPLLLGATITLGFLAVVVARSEPADPAARLPTRYKLADLIQAQQRGAVELQAEAAALRAAVDELREESEQRTGSAAETGSRLGRLQEVAGVAAVRGPGLKVTLDDSALDEPPDDGTVNDLVVHSQDVQAVVNALWRADAEAIAINGQRLVSTSAVLCVGNTLLLNGTVHSPPYVISAIGATRDRFDADRLVRRLRDDAQAFGRRFSVERASDLQLPGYTGATPVAFAKPI